MTSGLTCTFGTAKVTSTRTAVRCEAVFSGGVLALSRTCYVAASLLWLSSGRVRSGAEGVERGGAGVRFAALRLFVVVYVCAVESLNVFVHVVRFVRFVEGLPLMLQVENDDEKWLI